VYLNRKAGDIPAAGYSVGKPIPANHSDNVKITVPAALSLQSLRWLVRRERAILAFQDPKLVWLNGT
jgi:hypothetical protein